MSKKKKKVTKRGKLRQRQCKLGQAVPEVRIDLTYDDAIARIDRLAANTGVSRDEYVNGVALDVYEPPDDLSWFICDMLSRGQSFESLSFSDSGDPDTVTCIFF